MNGYEIVDKLIKDNRRYVSVNELSDMGDSPIDKDVAIMLLRKLYSGKYVEPFDSHFCGDYSFENPNCKKIITYQLYKIYLPKKVANGSPKIVKEKYSEDFKNIEQFIQFYYNDFTDEKLKEFKNNHYGWANENTLLFYREEKNYKE